MADRTLELYHQYSETGYQGKSEKYVEYRLHLTNTQTNIHARVVLEVETDRRSFPDRGDATTTFERYDIGAQELVELIKEHGRRVP